MVTRGHLGSCAPVHPWFMVFPRGWTWHDNHREVYGCSRTSNFGNFGTRPETTLLYHPDIINQLYSTHGISISTHVLSLHSVQKSRLLCGPNPPYIVHLFSQFADCCSRRGLSVDHQALTLMLSICVNLYTSKQASMLQWLEISMAGRALEVMSLDINSLAGCGFNPTSWYYITPGISFQLPRRVVAQAGTWAKAIGALWFLKLCLCEGTQTPEAHRTLGGQHQALRRR